MKKRWVLALLGAVLAAGLTGCGAQRDAAQAEDAPTLVIGIDSEYQPYSYLNDTGELVGVDIELAQEACRRMGYQAEHKPIQWDKKDDYLADGSIDCVWSCFTYTGREDKYLWAGPYLYSRQVAVVKSDSEIADLPQLAGKRIAVMSSTKPEQILLAADGAEIPVPGELLSYGTMDLAFTAMRRGYADAAAGHEGAVRQLIGSMKDDYRVLPTSLRNVEVGVAFKKDGDAALAKKLDDTLAEMAEDGTTAAIVEKYGLDTANVIRRDNLG